MTRSLRSSVYSIFVCVAIGCGGDDGTTVQDPDAGSGGGSEFPQPVDRSKYANVGRDTKLDYANPAYWLCRPDLDANECHADLDATEVKADGTLAPAPHVRAENPEIDCFYVYPTMWINMGPQMTDFSDTGVGIVRDALLSQAARFTSVCEVYVPFYRQGGLMGASPDPRADPQLALQDVRDAFQVYLKKYNKGRKFVILGHSQGSIVATELIARDVDGNDALRSQLLSAILLGGMPYTAPGEKTGGSFKNVPPCSEPGQTGCVVAYNSYAAEAPPASNAAFGVPNNTLSAAENVDPNGEIICTDPAPLAGHSGPYAETYFALKLNSSGFGAMPVPPPGVTTPFVLYRELLKGDCAVMDGRHYLSVSSTAGADDVRKPMYRVPILEQIGFGLHTVDYNIALGDLIALVRKQAQLD